MHLKMPLELQGLEKKQSKLFKVTELLCTELEMNIYLWYLLCICTKPYNGFVFVYITDLHLCFCDAHIELYVFG